MRGFTAVFGRELAERRMLLLLGITGLVPLLLPLFIPTYLGAADLRTVSAYFLAGIVAAVLALGLGGSILASDAAERRLGFYFSRPLSGGAIWGGKLAAALALAVGIGVLVLLPALLFETHARAEIAGFGAGRILLAVALLAALVLLAHALSTLLRTRSAWLALDLLAAAVVGLTAWSAAERLLRAGLTTPVATGGLLPPLFARPLTVVAPVVLAAFLAGSAAQILGGRTDSRRGHRFLSLTLWSLLLVAALGFDGYSRWLIAATPADLTGSIFGVAAAPRGSAVVVQGFAAHREGYFPVFLLDTERGNFARLFPALRWDWRGTVQFSADGRWATWLEPQSPSAVSPVTLFRLDLTRPGARPVPTRLTYATRPLLLALSPDGRRLATLESRRLTVEEVDSARLLLSVPIEAADPWESRLQFVDDTHLLHLHTARGEAVWPRPRAAIEIAELDLATGRQEVIGRTTSVEANSLADLSPDGSHFILHQSGERLLLFRTRGAVLLAEVPALVRMSGFLADGRIAAVEPTAAPSQDPRQLVLLSADGAVLRRFPFPGVRILRLAGEPSPGQLVVGVATRADGTPGRWGDHWDSQLLDLATGESRLLGRGLYPLGDLAAGPASVGPRLFERTGGRVLLLDPASGKERQLTGQAR
jgi:hypothetical protein